MKNSIVAFAVGYLFALGLALSGMTQPQKVVGFLDIFGNWDPSLLFVMIGAITTHGVLYFFVRKRAKPVFAEKFQYPTESKITKRLALGAVIFGFGWGLAGYCPGPAIVSLASLTSGPFIFVVSMICGMALYNLVTPQANRPG